MPVTPEWLALSLVEHLGGKRMRALLDHFHGDPGAILAASRDQLRRVPGIGTGLADAIRQIDRAQVERDLAAWQRAGVSLLTWEDSAYPVRLKTIPDPPPTLFVRGSGALEKLSAASEKLHPRRWIAVVGTRQPSAQSAAAAQMIGFETAQRGGIVVSGLALGVDAAAHLGALAAPNGLTLAVLGGGVLNIYPPGNRGLSSAVIQRGGLVSEQPPTADPKPVSLVARNRLISGLCDALVVVETSVTGGAMHAARRAFEQGRRVYALDSAASGNRALIDEFGALALDVNGFSGLWR
ncbi:MAG: DNA-processing protein DprA [bacterium]|nr:DNA-processing protein DprA [bacterium]